MPPTTTILRHVPVCTPQLRLNGGDAVWLGSVVLVDGQVASLVALFLAVVSVGGKLSQAGTGTVSTANGSATVTGIAGTSFVPQLQVGGSITIGGVTRTILAIAGAASLTTTANWNALNTAVAFTFADASKKVDSSLPAVYAGIYAGESVDPEAQPLRYVGLDFGTGFTPLPPRVVPEARGPTRVRVYVVNNMEDVESWATVCVTGALCVEG